MPAYLRAIIACFQNESRGARGRWSQGPDAVVEGAMAGIHPLAAGAQVGEPFGRQRRRLQHRQILAQLFQVPLRRQGLLEGTWCLDPRETLSPGQAEEIERVCRAYPDLSDDEFVARNRADWLGAAK